MSGTQPLVGERRVDQCQPGALSQRVMLEPGQEPGRQRFGREWATVGVPVRQRRQQLALPAGHRLSRANPDPGEKPQLGRIREQLDHGQVTQRPHRQPQPEQRGAAADEHLPANGIDPQLAVLVGVQLDGVMAGPEPPRLSVVHRWCPGRCSDQVIDLTGGDRHHPAARLRDHAAHLPSCVLRVSRPERNRQGPKTAQNADQRPALGEARAGRGTVSAGNRHDHGLRARAGPTFGPGWDSRKT